MENKPVKLTSIEELDSFFKEKGISSEKPVSLLMKIEVILNASASIKKAMNILSTKTKPMGNVSQDIRETMNLLRLIFSFLN